MFPLYLQYLLIDFRQTFVTDASWDTNDLITFLGQKVKVQGHTIAVEAHSTTVECNFFLFRFCRRWPRKIIYIMSSKETLLITECCTAVQLALSAASPIYRGFLADTDCRWNVISASVDDRTREERGIDVSLALFSPLPEFLVVCY